MVTKSNSLSRNLLRLGNLESHTVAHTVMLRVLARLSDGGFVKIESDELAIGIRLRHENGGEADAAADVGHLGAARRVLP